MVLPKIEERTLYPPIIDYLNKNGFRAYGETKVERKEPDILFKIDDSSFVVEVKIGKPVIGLKAVAQASDYAKKLKTNNVIILIYPEKYRNQVILKKEIIDKIALEEEIQAIILTDYWIDSVKAKTRYIFDSLKRYFLIKKRNIKLKAVVKLIETYVRDLNSITYQIKKEELIEEVVNKLDLFTAIGDIKNKEVAERQVLSLASYLLFNQLLFYHIYKRKTKDSALPELEQINKIESIQKYFDAIQKIDYQSIYKINILGHIPEKKIVIETLNDVIKAIKLLRAEHITHDLAGRFFHDLIPQEVRKVLAAFYTHPIAADLLVGLSIDSWNEKVIDPACGSGTLLVSSYRRKMEFYKKLYGYKNLGKIHKKFIEEDITGIDIMPFAGHITTINLTLQNIEQKTNIVRIASMDSLDLAKEIKKEKFKENGFKISSYTRVIQKTLFGASNQKSTIGKEMGALSPSGRGGEFVIKPVDVVIMNPPFSDREKMPKEMREKLKENKILTDICGNQINLWGYFIVLADLFLKPGGKIAAVIPINIARGKATEKIRNFLLKNYHIKYLITPVGNKAFSEGASFKDILFIAEKRKPKEGDLTKIIYLKKSIREIDEREINKLISKIEGNYKFSTNELDIFSIKFKKLEENKENLMPIIGFKSINNMETLNYIFNTIKSNEKIKESIKKSNLIEGFHASPEGLSELVFITRPLDESRTKRAFLIFKNKIKNTLEAHIKKSGIIIKIPKEVTTSAIRTITGINKINITKTPDYLITSSFKDFNKILNLSKWKSKKIFSFKIVKDKMKGKNWFAAVPSRFRLNSKNTKILAIYNDDGFYAPHTFKMLTFKEKNVAKFYTIILNSILFMLNFVFLRSQTTLGFTDLRESDLITFKLLNINNLSQEEKKEILNLFEKLKDIEFPSIIDQLKNRFWARVELDKTIFKILGFSNKEINEWLPKVYDALVDELK